MSDIYKDFVKSLMEYNEQSKELSSCMGALTALKRLQRQVGNLSKMHEDGDYYIRKEDFEDTIKREKEHILMNMLNYRENKL